MKIDKILLIGIVTLAFAIVLVTTILLTLDMLKMASINLAELNSVSTNVKEQNADMFGNLNQKATEVNTHIYEITGKAAEEQLRNVGNGIAEEIKAVMDKPFVSVNALGTTIMFQKREAEKRGEAPSREWTEHYLYNFLENNDEIQALFNCWEKNAFDGLDEEFIGKENPDDDMEKSDSGYVSEGAFLPWFYRSEDDAGNPRIIRGFTDDYHDNSANSYYIGPRDTKKEYITEPYVDGGLPITTFSIPMMEGDRVLGVVGIDVSLEGLQEIVEKRKPFESGFAMFFSPGGQIVYYPDKEINYREVVEDGETEMEYQKIDRVPGLQETAKHIRESKHLQDGESVIYTSKTLPGREGTEMLVIHVPVQFGNYDAKWTVAVAAPASRVMQNRDHAKTEMDEMLEDLQSRNQKFTAQLDDRVRIAVEASEAARVSSLYRSIIFGIIVLIVSIAFGAYFAVWVNRSIVARDFRYRQILDTCSDPISVVDMNMKIVFVNKRALVLLRKTMDECLGKDVEEVWKSVIGPAYSTCGLRLLQTQGKKLSRLQFSDIYWDISSDYIVDSNNMHDGMVEIFKDVSDRENVFILVERVDEIIKSTVEQTGSIAQAASELSNGAQQQAQSVESITGDMRSTNEQTRQNAENAAQADHLSTDAGKAATLGQSRMREMMEAMNQINDNAQNMRAVIKTIDDIAFQTNLLALNAAVEAARAGQHGKGFAVVAEEVRNLASRSAKAAQETEELIIKSNEQVTNGVAVADQTAEALNTIAEHVSSVSKLIGLIDAASTEQTTSVNRMSTTLQTVDQITQHNVDLATTTANATQLLSAEVNELQNLMERLRKNRG